ncbi:hypothetical protein NDN08_004535 [Rhodosorus marinus]|uniref:Right handed beta helix domain-containing protein n=1 Tax=Rhodosorus marinus TaxID=101924 RepID=A0AAV8UQP0_9RHOD|nr:hypothetical protein NDN08_004535 [Rhodosorus marinus]
MCVWQESKPILVLKPMTIRSIRVVLNSTNPIPLLRILAKSVTITDFELNGNNMVVLDSRRQALMQVFKSGFHIARGTFRNSTKDGVVVRSIEGSPSITGGVLRYLIGTLNNRDVVSLTTLDGGKTITKNIVVENIRAYGSRDRGAVEISDGVEDMFVRNVYAIDCYYAVSIQDHGVSELETIRRVFVSNVVAVRSDFAIVSQVESIRHGDVSTSRVFAKNCIKALELQNLDWVRVDDVRVIAPRTTGYALEIINCKDLKIRDVSFVGGGKARGAIMVMQSSNVRIAGVTVDRSSNFHFGISVFKKNRETQSGFQISQVDLAAVKRQEIQVADIPPHWAALLWGGKRGPSGRSETT